MSWRRALFVTRTLKGWRESSRDVVRRMGGLSLEGGKVCVGCYSRGEFRFGVSLFFFFFRYELGLDLEPVPLPRTNRGGNHNDKHWEGEGMMGV